MADTSPNLLFFNDGKPNPALTFGQSGNPAALVFSETPATNGNLLFGGNSAGGSDATPLDLSGTFPSLSSNVHATLGWSASVGGTLPSLRSSVRVLPTWDGSVSSTLPSLRVSLTVLPSVEVGLDVQLPSMGGYIKVLPQSNLDLTATLPSMSSSLVAAYDARVSRPTVCHAHQAFQEADRMLVSSSAEYQSTVPKALGPNSSYSSALRVGSSVRSVLPNLLEYLQFSPLVRYQDALTVRQGLGDLYHQMIPTYRPNLAVRYQGALARRYKAFNAWQDMIHGHRPQLDLHYQPGRGRRRSFSHELDMGSKWEFGCDGRYQGAAKPQPGKPYVPPNPPPSKDRCYTPSPTLIFSEGVALDGSLLFVCEKSLTPELPNAGIVIPVRKAYIIMNEVRLYRVDGNVEIPVQSLSLDIDMDSWTWGFKANLPMTAFSEVYSSGGSPVELEVRVNGQSYIVIAESIERQRAFGSSSLAVSGRGHSAYLSSPFSSVMNFSNSVDGTAQQLMNNALMTNGVSIGWEVDWGLTDWFIPAGVWSMQGTYMDAVKSIASAAGAFILPHRNQKKLFIKPRYALAPWEWASATPDIQLPSSVVETERVQWQEKPRYEGVYVSGVSQGVLGFVKRTGTSGGYQAPMVTDSLITHADAARQRGKAILSDTGRISTIQLSLPVLPETGIIEPGKMVRYVDGSEVVLGLTKSVSVSMSGQPTLRQTIVVETHG